MSISKRRREKIPKSFVMLPRMTLNREHWRELSPSVKILYVHLKAKYNGQNNGQIRLHYSELVGIKGLSSPSTNNKFCPYWWERSRNAVQFLVVLKSQENDKEGFDFPFV